MAHPSMSRRQTASNLVSKGTSKRQPYAGNFAEAHAHAPFWLGLTTSADIPVTVETQKHNIGTLTVTTLGNCLISYCKTKPPVDANFAVLFLGMQNGF
jgi:hypothetical protein